MGEPWRNHPSWEIVGDASDAAGRDLAYLLLAAGAEELTETRNAQLATFTMSLIVLDAIERLGIEPTATAGHSVGEYTALVAAGALGFEDGVRLVAERGEAMQDAADANPGTMKLIAGSDAETVDIACHLAGGDVWLANDNSSEETVIAGEQGAVEAAAMQAVRLGARKVEDIAVGGAFHTPFMAPARERLAKAIRKSVFHAPEIPVIANADARAHQAAESWELLLLAQLTSPVRWRRSVLALSEAAASEGIPEGLFVEIGAGRALGKLVAQTRRDATTMSVCTPDDLDILVDAVAGETSLGYFAADHYGEQIYVSERMVISPCAGVFEPIGGSYASDSGLEADTAVEVGTLLGSVSGTEVRSPFAGRLMGMLAHPDERLQTGQPIAWLRTA